LGAPEITRLASAQGVDLSADQARQLTDAFGGWPAAVRLVLSEWDGSSRSLPLTRAEHYLREAVLGSISDREKLEAIARLALAERLTHGLIRDLAADEHRDADAAVRAFESPGLAERRYGDGDIEVLLPDFIRAALRHLFESQHPACTRDTHRWLSHWYLEHRGPDHLLHAFRHATKAEDWGLLDSIWTRNATRLAFDHLEQLSDIISVMDPSVRATRPSLDVAAEMSRAGQAAEIDHGRFEVICHAYAQASRRRMATAHRQGSLYEHLYLGTGNVLGLRLSGDLDAADDAASALIAMATTRSGRGEELGDRLAWLHQQHGTVLALAGQFDRAAVSFRLCWEQRHNTAPQVAAQAAAQAGLMHALRGDSAAAEEWLARQRQVEVGGAWQPVLEVCPQLAVALIRLDQLDRSGCLTALATVRDATLAPELWPFAAYVRTQASLQFDDPDAALATLETIKNSHSPSEQGGAAARMLLSRSRADLLLATGQPQRAHAALQSVAAGTDRTAELTTQGCLDDLLGAEDS
jgi:hypothetical protein